MQIQPYLFFDGRCDGAQACPYRQLARPGRAGRYAEFKNPIVAGRRARTFQVVEDQWAADPEK